MALLDSDLLAVWRDTDQQNYKTTISQIVARVPAPEAPSLTAVLQTNNTAQNVGIIIEDNSQDQTITLNPDGSATFVQDVTVNTQVIVGATPKIYLKSDGEIKGHDINLLGNSTTATAIAVYSAGSDIAALDTNDQVVNITNTGAATFAGALEALSVDGGIYAE